MEIKVVRKYFSDRTTIGELFIDGIFFCYTLEDMVRQVKVKHETAIPYGTYDLSLVYSSKYGKKVPSILNVPGFAGILIHPGNTIADTSGCLLVGFEKSKDGNSILQSKVAFAAFLDRINKSIASGQKKLKISFEYEEIEHVKKLGSLVGFFLCSSYSLKECFNYV
jgi:hypothetical protein